MKFISVLLFILVLIIIFEEHKRSENKRFDAVANISARHAQLPMTRSAHQKKYAILVSCKSEIRHVNVMLIAYQFVQKRGYLPENTYILDDFKFTKRFEMPYPVDGRPTTNALNLIFRRIEKEARPGDTIFFFVTGHGTIMKNLQKKPTFLPIEPTYLLENDLFQMVKDIPSNFIFVFNQCYGGGFAQKMSNLKANHIAISVSRREEESYINYFPHLFFQAFLRNDADNDKNGKIDVKEAFDFAVRHDPPTQAGKQTPTCFEKGGPFYP